jgi:hypothetical protein
MGLSVAGFPDVALESLKNLTEETGRRVAEKLY